MHSQIVSVILALTLAISAVPNPPGQKLCPEPIITEFATLPAAPPGVPGSIVPVQSPYLGLGYSSAWRAVQAGNVVQPGPKSILFALQTQLLTPPTISVDRDSCSASLFQLKSFDWFAVLDLGQPELTATINATLKLTGTKQGASQPVTATCDYVGGGLVVPVAGVFPTPQTCSLPSTFNQLTSVKYEVLSASPISTTAEIVVAQLDYVLYKCC